MVVDAVSTEKDEVSLVEVPSCLKLLDIVGSKSESCFETAAD